LTWFRAYKDACVYEQVVLADWHISPLEIEREWTDEQFNLYVASWSSRRRAEMRAEAKAHAGRPSGGGDSVGTSASGNTVERQKFTVWDVPAKAFPSGN
jgi:hypothetical protein